MGHPYDHLEPVKPTFLRQAGGDFVICCFACYYTTSSLEEVEMPETGLTDRHLYVPCNFTVHRQCREQCRELDWIVYL